VNRPGTRYRCRVKVILDPAADCRRYRVGRDKTGEQEGDWDQPEDPGAAHTGALSYIFLAICGNTINSAANPRGLAKLA
jgi:hypothetical protein